MKLSAKLKAIQSALSDWQKKYAATVEPARDVIHVFGLLTTKPGSARAAILFRDEDKRGEFEEAGQADDKFWIVISQGRSLQLKPGEQLTEGSAGGAPLLDLVEDARDAIRAMSFDADTTEVTPDYKGTHNFEAEGWLIAAYYIEITIGTQLPSVAQ